MVAPCDIILTSSNYFSWKSRMEDVLWSMGLFKITSGKEIEPTDDDKKLNGKIDVMKLVDWLGCQSLLICDSTYLELMNLILLGKSWNLCLVNTMKFGVINLRMSWFPWIQMIFHAFKTIYLSIKLLDSYVKNAILRKEKTMYLSYSF